MTAFQAVVMAILQGVTELFPVSSLGHAVILPRLLHWSISNVLKGNLTAQLGHVNVPAGLSTASVTPALFDKLPAAVHHGIAVAYANSISTVFTIAAPIGLLAFAFAWLIPQVELRRAISDPALEAPIAAPSGEIAYARDP